MKNETILKHKSGVKFQYVETFTPQFSEQAFVKLLNLKSGKHECFMANTYKQFFTEVSEPLESTIPFCGFYNSVAESLIDHEIESLFDIDGSGECEVPNDFWLSHDSSATCKAFAKIYVESYQEWLKDEFDLDIELSFKLLDSPRECNFATDRIFVTLSDSDLAKLASAAVEHGDLRKEVKERFESRSGFISHYSSDVSDWGKVETWDYNQIGTLFECLGEPDYFEIMENACGNGEISNAVWEGISEAGKALLPELV